jgi:hypothetical protein
LQAGTEAKSEVASIAVAATEHEKLIAGFVNQDITVAKGDSVWKISGRLADQLNLEGAERTHFIDSLKDKFGDVPLQEGEIINFSEKGIDKEFIENALGKSGSLTAEQISSIEANDANIAEFSRENPHVTLTNEGVDQILHPNPSVGVSASDVNVPRTHVLPSGLKLVPIGDLTLDDGDSTVTNLQNQLNVADTKIDMLHQGYVELQHLPRAEDWSSQIFGTAPNESLGMSSKTFAEIQNTPISSIQGDIESIMRDKKIYADGQIVGGNSGLQGWQLKNFTDFSNSKESSLKLSTYMKSLPWSMQDKVTLGDYIKHVTPLVKPGDRLGASGLYTTTK